MDAGSPTDKQERYSTPETSQSPAHRLDLSARSPPPRSVIYGGNVYQTPINASFFSCLDHDAYLRTLASSCTNMQSIIIIVIIIIKQTESEIKYIIPQFKHTQL